MNEKKKPLTVVLLRNEFERKVHLLGPTVKSTGDSQNNRQLYWQPDNACHHCRAVGRKRNGSFAQWWYRISDDAEVTQQRFLLFAFQNWLYR